MRRGEQGQESENANKGKQGRISRRGSYQIGGALARPREKHEGNAGEQREVASEESREDKVGQRT